MNHQFCITLFEIDKGRPKMKNNADNSHFPSHYLLLFLVKKSENMIVTADYRVPRWSLAVGNNRRSENSRWRRKSAAVLPAVGRCLKRKYFSRYCRITFFPHSTVLCQDKMLEKKLFIMVNRCNSIVFSSRSWRWSTRSGAYPAWSSTCSTEQSPRRLPETVVELTLSL